ncbi:MAG: hypothetical protein JWP82_3150, partial [Humibacillus sp.]|nr:hypothetical protein [Humibacillus sp.]
MPRPATRRSLAAALACAALLGACTGTPDDAATSSSASSSSAPSGSAAPAPTATPAVPATVAETTAQDAVS